jgi:hypothetical protein
VTSATAPAVFPNGALELVCKFIVSDCIPANESAAQPINLGDFHIPPWMSAGVGQRNRGFGLISNTTPHPALPHKGGGKGFGKVQLETRTAEFLGRIYPQMALWIGKNFHDSFHFTSPLVGEEKVFGTVV